jgi:hypothetical protein
MFIIAAISRTIGNWARRSSGIEGRPALYSGYASNRNCGLPTSKLSIAKSGFRSCMPRSTICRNPKTAFTRVPSDMVSGGSAK